MRQSGLRDVAGNVLSIPEETINQLAGEKGKGRENGVHCCALVGRSCCDNLVLGTVKGEGY